MNLKEAFRFQNKLQSMMDEAQSILGSTANITKVQNTYLRKKVMPEAENETTIDAPATEYSEQITLVAEFLLHLLSEREKLSVAIFQAKAGLNLPAGLDGEVSLNSKRQEVAGLFRRMAGLRSSEVLIPNGGTGYRFNNEGNQVSYRCDVKRVTTINFDRNKMPGIGFSSANRFCNGAGNSDMIIFNKNRIIKPHTMISATAGTDSILLEYA